MIDCAECGNKISDNAAACPKCGNPTPGSDVGSEPDPLDLFWSMAKSLVGPAILVVIGIVCWSLRREAPDRKSAELVTMLAYIFWGGSIVSFGAGVLLEAGKKRL